MIDIGNKTPLYKGVYLRLRSIFEEVIVLTSEEDMMIFAMN